MIEGGRMLHGGRISEAMGANRLAGSGLQRHH
jgi:hypothetical protein